MTVTTNDPTRTIIAEMLKENTGTHFLDSGMAYGRHWQQNQNRDFERERASTLEIDKHWINVTHNVYHWLVERVGYDPALDDIFQQWCEINTSDADSWLASMEMFTDFLAVLRDDDVIYATDADTIPRIDDYYAEDVGSVFLGRAEEIMTVNTYNGEDMLSQILQYHRWIDAISREEYVLLQIHGGCDARGGYTQPRLFRVTEEYALFDNACATIQCAGHDLALPSGDRYQREPHCWYTDDACHWYRDGVVGYGALAQLETYDRLEIDDRMAWVQGMLCYIDNAEETVALCPVCGAELSALPY